MITYSSKTQNAHPKMKCEGNMQLHQLKMYSGGTTSSCKQKTNSRQATGLAKVIFLILIGILHSSLVMAANVAPVFVLSSPQGLAVCQNAAATDIIPLLRVSDPDGGQTETWSQQSAPGHGSLSFIGATGSTGAGGTNIAPGGSVKYTPTAGYSGPDAFNVKVDDGNGGSANMVINVTVNPTPTVNTITNQAACNTAATTAVTFTGAVPGTAYNWTNNTPSIGLAANSSGNIPSFSVVNTGTSPVVATVTVTPIANTCTGANRTFTITANPTPVANTVGNQAVCNNAAVTGITFGSNVSGTTYAWTNNTTSIGLAASGSANIASFTGTNTGTAPVVATVTVTPTANTCPGANKTFTLTVNPTPVVNTISDQAVCQGSASTAVTFGGTVTGSTYAWTNSLISIGLGATGTGNIAAFTASNSGSAPVVATVTVTPTANTCPGASKFFTITVNPMRVPAVSIAALPGTTVCAGTLVAFAATPVYGGTTPSYQWKVNGNNVGANSDNFTSTNLANSGIVTCIVTTNVACPTTPTATSNAVVMTVNKITDINDNAWVPEDTICEGKNTMIVVRSTGTGLTYKWQEDSGSGFGDMADGTVVSGCSTDTLKLKSTPAALDGNNYRCLVYGICGNDTSQSTRLTVFTYPRIAVQPVDDSVQNFDTAHFNIVASGSSITYQWQVDTGSGFENIWDNYAYQGTHTDSLKVSGTWKLKNGYIFRCIVSGLCSKNDTSEVAGLKVSVPSAISEVSNLISNVRLFPNPNKGIFTLRGEAMPGEPLTFELLNMMGQVLSSEIIINSSRNFDKTMDAGDLPAGTYLLKIKTQNQVVPMRFSVSK